MPSEPYPQELVDDLEPGRGVLIAGTWWPTAKRFPVQDPATQKVIAEVSHGTATEANAAVDAAAAALPAWSATSGRDRAEVLRRAYELMIADSERLAALISWENGKSAADGRAEAAYAAEFFRWYAEEAPRAEGRYGPAPAGGGARTIVTHRPVGVAALVTPWNFPAAMATRKIGPALAAGCTVILKPAALTPLTALAVARILERAGVPSGVVTVVPTRDAGSVVDRWLADPRVAKLSFTGSTSVGRGLLARAADRVVNVSMELGGNAPFVVTADADLDAAVAGAMIAKFRNGGQACTAANRFYVHADVAAEFTARFGEAVEALTVGPAPSGADIGPMVSRSARDDVARLVDEALEAGARIAHRGGDPGHWYYPPTVLSNVAPDAAILREEIFGPVAPIVIWDDETELLRHVNEPELGLAAYVYAGRLQHALRLAEAFDAGMVGVNRGMVSDPSAPFGGVKQSGLGREGAREGIREYQEAQYFSVSLD